VRSRSFTIGDFVLRLKKKKVQKQQSPWEGPFIIKEVLPGGAYRIRDMKKMEDESNPWNAAHLRRFYP
jgi:hypothetical protein